MFVFGACAGFTAAPRALANPVGIGGSFEEIVRLAHKEGKVRFGSSPNAEEARLVLEAFEKTYPKIKVEYTANVDGAVSERVLTEALAGTVEYDLVNVPSALQAKFRKADVLSGPLDWRNMFPKVPREHFSPDNYFAVVSFIARVIAYNTSLVPAERVPKNWQDCLDPYWKGKFLVRTRPHAFVGIWSSWGEERTIEYVKRLKDNQPIWGSASYEESALQVTSGEAAMMCGTNYPSVFNLLRRDPQAKIAAVFPTETPIGMGETIGILKGAKSPNAAYLLAGWLGSLEGQKGYEKNGRDSPFIEGTEMRRKFQKAGVKIVFGGWQDEEYAPARTKKITSVWGFR
jgi:iron(III) transport system substrate-binding protein